VLSSSSPASGTPYVPHEGKKSSVLAADGTALSVTVRGSVGEVVDVAFAPPPTEEEAAAKTVTVRCVLTESGAARVTVDGATRECVAL